MAKGRYRLMAGCFECANPKFNPNQPESETNKKSSFYNWMVPGNNIIESDQDLVAMYGEKFIRLDDGISDEVATKLGLPESKESVFTFEELEAKTVRELRKIAMDAEIDLETANSKEEIINCIMAGAAS